MRVIIARHACVIPTLGYNFSLAGVAGRVKGGFERGGAIGVGMDGPVNEPIPNGMVWNMVYSLHELPSKISRDHENQSFFQN